MKKFLKNILLTFVIIYTVLSIMALTVIEVGRRQVLYEKITEISSENRTMEMYEEKEKIARDQIENVREVLNEKEGEVPIPATELTLFQMYYSGAGHVIEIQIIVLICSACLSIAIGIIVSLREESKIKEISYFIAVGLGLNLIVTSYLKTSFPQLNYTETFLENILHYGLSYIIIFMIVYLLRYYLEKKQVNKLNKELKDKQK